MLIANLFGILLLLFFLWKRLKDDYHYEKIFNLSLSIFIGLMVGYLISIVAVLSTYWFWLLVLGISIGFTINIINQKINFFESFEGLTVGMLSWIGLYFLAHAIINSNLSSFLYFWFTLFLVFLFFFLDSQYKNFNWYKSGRVGFAGVVALLIFFIIRSMVSIFFPATVSIAGGIDIYLSSTVAIVLFLLLYTLTKRTD